MSYTNKTTKAEQLTIVLKWMTSFDLDLHCFALTWEGKAVHAYYGDKISDHICLDRDAGVNRTVNNKGNREVCTIDFKGQKVRCALLCLHAYNDFQNGEGFCTLEPTMEIFNTRNWQSVDPVVEVPFRQQKDNSERWFVVGLFVDSGDQVIVYKIGELLTYEPLLSIYYEKCYGEGTWSQLISCQEKSSFLRRLGKRFFG